MSDVVIETPGLGKHDTTGCQAADGRDVLAQNARSLWCVPTDLLRGRPLILGNEPEKVWSMPDVRSATRYVWTMVFP